MTVADVADRFTDLINEDRPGLFDEMARAVFDFQRASSGVYSRYCKAICPRGESINAIEPHHFPFLPVDAFKHEAITTFDPGESTAVFRSSDTGGGGRSRHYVRDLRIYERAVTAGFDDAFGFARRRIVAYLPEYGPDSSLIYMMRHLIAERGAEGSRFILGNPDDLDGAAEASRRDGTPLMVFGAAFGLLDLIEDRQHPLPEDALVVETGGMKTHRREITRRGLHDRLAEGFGVPRANIRSEYGMCELMSQAYTHGSGAFAPPPWMRFYVMDPLEPQRVVDDGQAGILAIVDLANLYSCSFLLTGDRAVKRRDGVEILGRLTGAELRGCNFLLENV